MKILVVSQYFWPESFIINDVVETLSCHGHSVTVATGKPNYPHGVIAEGYTKKGIQHERLENNVEIIRVPVRPRKKAKIVDLSLNYLSFVFSSSLYFPWLLRRREFDLVFFFGVSPLTAAIPAIILSKLKRAHLALWIQDLWPDSISAAGFIKNRQILSVFGLMVKSIYKSADTILLQSKAFHEPVSAYTSSKKLFYFPNPAPRLPSVDTELIPERIKEQFRGVFSVVFAGNLGKVQALQTLVDAADLLKGYANIRFIVIGAGSEAIKLSRALKDRELTNIVMMGHIARELMPAILQSSSLLMITLRADPSLDLVIPSKLQAYLQAGRPIVAAMNGEGARVVKDAGAGLVAKAEDPVALANNIKKLYQLPEASRDLLGNAGRKYYEKHFKLEKIIEDLVQIIKMRTEIKSVK